MTLLAVSPTIDTSPSTLTTDLSRRATDEEKREPPSKAWAPPGKGCLRCGGLLVPSYTSPLERDAEGKPITLWHCVNCGDYMDRGILANRGNGAGPARVRARPPVGPQLTGLVRGVGTGMAR